jgi:hypothetical protein
MYWYTLLGRLLASDRTEDDDYDDCNDNLRLKIEGRRGVLGGNVGGGSEGGQEG